MHIIRMKRHQTAGLLCVRHLVSGRMPPAIVQRWKYVANLIGVPEESARRMVLRNDVLQRLNEDRIENTYNALKDINVSAEDIVAKPNILNHFPAYIEGRYWSLVDFGLRPIKIPEILGYKVLMCKRSDQLKSLDLLPENAIPLQHLLDKLPNFDATFLDRYPSTEAMTLLYLRKLILLEFISQRLKCSKKEVLSIISKYPAIANKGICSMQHVIDVLVNRLGFSTDTVKANGFLLTVSQNNIDKIVALLASVFQQDRLLAFIHKYPKTLRVSTTKLRANTDSLRRFGFTQDQMMRYGIVFSMCTATLQGRLHEMNTTEEFENLKSHPRVLSLVHNMNTAKRRLPILKGIGMNNPSFNALNASMPTFDHTVSNTSSRAKTETDMNRVARLLGKSELVIAEKFAQHPRRMSKDNVPGILNLLLTLGFTSHQIWNGLHVLLHDITTVKKYVRLMPRLEECQPFMDWQRHPFGLQLLLYVIEKHSHASEVISDRSAVNTAVEESREPKATLPELKYGLCVSDSSVSLDVESFPTSKKTGWDTRQV